jgi:hypothetical protein
MKLLPSAYFLLRVTPASGLGGDGAGHGSDAQTERSRRSRAIPSAAFSVEITNEDTGVTGRRHDNNGQVTVAGCRRQLRRVVEGKRLQKLLANPAQRRADGGLKIQLSVGAWKK